MAAVRDDSEKPPMSYGYFRAYQHILQSNSNIGNLYDYVFKIKEASYNGQEGALLNVLDKLYEELIYILGIDYVDSFERISHIAREGALIYGDMNYREGFPYSRILGSLVRHINKLVQEGVDSKDDKSGLPHIDHTLSNICMFIEHVIDDLGVNDLIQIKKEKK